MNFRLILTPFGGTTQLYSSDFMCFFSRRHKQDQLAREIANRYNMLDDYIAARQYGLSPLEALEDWDMLTPEERHSLENICSHQNSQRNGH